MFFKQMKARLGILGEFFSFLWQRKLWWLIPLMLVLFVFSALLIVAASSGGLMPFIYTLF